MPKHTKKAKCQMYIPPLRFDKCSQCDAPASSNIIPIVYGDFSTEWPEEFDSGKACYGGTKQPHTSGDWWLCTRCKSKLPLAADEDIESFFTTKKELLPLLQGKVECEQNLFAITDKQIYDATAILLGLNKHIEGVLLAYTYSYTTVWGGCITFCIDTQRIIKSLACGEITFVDIVEFDKAVHEQHGEYFAAITGDEERFLESQRSMREDDLEPLVIEADPLGLFTGPFSVRGYRTEIMDRPPSTYEKGQKPDTVTIKGWTYDLLAYPLESFFTDTNPKPYTFTPSYPAYKVYKRGYLAHWTIVDGYLCLEELDLSVSNHPEHRGMDVVFPGQAKPVRAEWYTGRLRLELPEEPWSAQVAYEWKDEQGFFVEIEAGKVVESDTLGQKVEWVLFWDTSAKTGRIVKHYYARFNENGTIDLLIHSTATRRDSKQMVLKPHYEASITPDIFRVNVLPVIDEPLRLAVFDTLSGHDRSFAEKAFEKKGQHER